MFGLMKRWCSTFPNPIFSDSVFSCLAFTDLCVWIGLFGRGHPYIWTTQFFLRMPPDHVLPWIRSAREEFRSWLNTSSYPPALPAGRISLLQKWWLCRSWKNKSRGFDNFTMFFPSTSYSKNCTQISQLKHKRTNILFSTVHFEYRHVAKVSTWVKPIYLKIPR